MQVKPQAEVNWGIKYVKVFISIYMTEGDARGGGGGGAKLEHTFICLSLCTSGRAGPNMNCPEKCHNCHSVRTSCRSCLLVSFLHRVSCSPRGFSSTACSMEEGSACLWVEVLNFQLKTFLLVRQGPDWPLGGLFRSSWMMSYVKAKLLPVMFPVSRPSLCQSA